MPSVKIENLNNFRIPFTENSQTLLQLFHNSGVDWMHACGGKGRCTTCKAIITEGLESLLPLTEREAKMRQTKRLGENERLACQCRPDGQNDLSLRVAEANKLPHLDYSD